MADDFFSSLFNKATKELNNLGREVSSLGKEMGGYFNKEDIGTTVPAVNIIETEAAFELEVAAPGMAKEDFKINLDEKSITISTAKEEPAMQSGKHYKMKEFDYGSFKRSFSVPKEVDTALVKAAYEGGVLKVTLPKKDEFRTKPGREIDIF